MGWILDSFSVEPGLRIPDSLNCVLDSNAQVPELTAKICCITDSTSINFPDSGNRIPRYVGRIIDTVQSLNGIVITHLLCTFCSSCHRERK